MGSPGDSPFTSQSTRVVGAPVTVDVNIFVFAPPEGKVQEVGEIVTIGGGMTVTTEVTDNFGSSYETAATFTFAGEGTTMGAMYLPDASILPTMSFPPGTPFTCHLTMPFVPPEMPAWNVIGVATVTDAVIGEIAMLIPVTGSVHVEEDVSVDVVAVVVVHVMAVLAGAAG
jgi:hypothetical protein